MYVAYAYRPISFNFIRWWWRISHKTSRTFFVFELRQNKITLFYVKLINMTYPFITQLPYSTYTHYDAAIFNAHSWA